MSVNDLKERIKQEVIDIEAAENGLSQILGDIEIARWFVAKVMKRLNANTESKLSIEQLLAAYFDIYLYDASDKLRKAFMATSRDDMAAKGDLVKQCLSKALSVDPIMISTMNTETNFACLK